MTDQEVRQASAEASVQSAETIENLRIENAALRAAVAEASEILDSILSELSEKPVTQENIYRCGEQMAAALAAHRKD